MKTFRIKEIENNFVYDDIYDTVEEAVKIIEEYIADDGESREVTYAVIDNCGETVYES
ncbi:MAG: hypothetical protein ACI4I1_06650 [Oscillospiraceae bacterium]